MLQACRIVAYIVRLAHIPNYLRQVHKSAHLNGRQLKSHERYFDISSPNAFVDNFTYKFCVHTPYHMSKSLISFCYTKFKHP